MSSIFKNLAETDLKIKNTPENAPPPKLVKTSSAGLKFTVFLAFLLSLVEMRLTQDMVTAFREPIALDA